MTKKTRIEIKSNVGTNIRMRFTMYCTRSFLKKSLTDSNRVFFGTPSCMLSDLYAFSSIGKFPFLKNPEAWERVPASGSHCLIRNYVVTKASRRDTFLLCLEQCPVVDDVLVLIQVVRYQQIRIVVNLGADQAVSADRKSVV